MPSIEISQELFKRIQRHAIPLVDTAETAIARAFDALEKGPTTPSKPKIDDARVFDGEAPPDLTFATLLAANLDGKEIKNPYWNTLMDEAIRLGFKAYGSLKELRQHCPGNYVNGQKDDGGYHYMPDLGISVQGRDANAVWRATSQLCKQLGISVAVEFRWAHKEHIKYPGETGQMAI